MIDFDSPEVRSILPYRETDQYQLALSRVLKDQALGSSLQNLFPLFPWQDVMKYAPQIRGVEDFHRYVVAPVVEGILQSKSSGLSLSGIEDLKNKNHRFVILSNHRDIVCDPAILCYCFFVHGLGSPYICLGDNLLTQPLIVDLVKLNQAITVKRDLPPRELLKWSKILSQVIHDLVTRENQSVWIAQREGRAKDGDDRTHPGVLKMLALAEDGAVVEAMRKLHVVPIAISYEYDPCDALKARELYLTEKKGSYEKSPNEDELSMQMGVLGFKGRIHVGIGGEWSQNQLEQIQEMNKRDQVNALVQGLDQEIHRLYKKWPSHYIAYDLLHGTAEMVSQYHSDEKQAFIDRMNQQLLYLKKKGLAGDEDLEGIERIFLEAYAKPLQGNLLV